MTKEITWRLSSGAASCLLFVFAVPAFGHGGGLDGYGCHNNRKAGGYHCHRGPLAGQSFASKEAVVGQLKKKESADNRRPPVQGERAK